MNIVTILGHLAILYEQGHNIDILAYCPSDSVQDIQLAINSLGDIEGKLKPIFDFCKGKYDYGIIRLVIAYFNKKIN